MQQSNSIQIKNNPIRILPKRVVLPRRILKPNCHSSEKHRRQLFVKRYVGVRNWIWITKDFVIFKVVRKNKFCNATEIALVLMAMAKKKHFSAEAVLKNPIRCRATFDSIKNFSVTCDLFKGFKILFHPARSFKSVHGTTTRSLLQTCKNRNVFFFLVALDHF